MPTFFPFSFGKQKAQAEADAAKVAEFETFSRRIQTLVSQNRVDALVDFQRLLLRPIQSHHISDAYLNPDHRSPESLNPFRDFGPIRVPGPGTTFTEFLSKHGRLPVENAPAALLGRDAILPTCWSPASIMNTLGVIGTGLKCGPWLQELNHSVTWWYPMNIYWVLGGNHSIAQGVLRAEGAVQPDDAYDLSGLFPHLSFDGETWIDSKSGTAIGKPRYKELGYVYEIGRHLHQLTTAS